MSNFLKIYLVGAEVFHADGRADGQTEVTKLMVAIRNFANSPKYECFTYKVSQKSITDF